MSHEPLAPQPVQTPIYSILTISESVQLRNGGISFSRPTEMVPFCHRIQNPRNSFSFRMPGVGTSATSGLLLFLRIMDLVFPQPPMNTSYIGSTSAAAVERTICASLGVLILNWTIPDEFGKKLYSSLSSV